MQPSTIGHASWLCPNCAESCDTRFCPQCGERPLPGRDLALRAVAAKALHATTSVDGQLLRTLTKLFRRPGYLTAAYVGGRRMPYLAPFKLFLVANAVFFGVQSLTGINVFSSTLESHLHQQDWSELARALVAHHLDRAHTTLETYAPVFDRAVILYAKSLIVLMVLPFALLLPLIYWTAHKPLITHFTFALHQYTFLLFFFCLSLFAAKAEALLGGAGIESPRVDTTLSLINLAACGTYIFLASGRAYLSTGAARWLKAALAAAVSVAIVIGYRFILLPITLSLT
jgi:hypothetical protein